MKSYPIQLAFAALLFFTGCTNPSWDARSEGISETRETSTYFTFHDRRYSQTLRGADLEQYPEWEPEDGPCPLALSKAVELAGACLRDHFPDVAHWTFDESAALHRFSKGRWYYEISFHDEDPDVHGDVVRMNSITVTVCLNGWVPKIVEETPKD